MFGCLRWGSGRTVAIVCIAVVSALTLLYAWTDTITSSFPARENWIIERKESFAEPHNAGERVSDVEGAAEYGVRPEIPPDEDVLEPEICLSSATADIDTGTTLSQFEFQPHWMKSREYWDDSFETRYKVRRKTWNSMPLKVIVVPHSHNDPGWLKTFETYYHYQSRKILDNMAEKLTKFKNMTFIWSEMILLAQWWKSAHPTKRRLVKKLLNEGRLEIMTGGWVMTDEANTHVFAMVDQLIQGHQWAKNKLGIEPNSGWSIDPFGHGSTLPYLLKEAGLGGGTVIQRIHYAWKQWLAKESAGDFIWRQNWDSEGHGDMFTHNLPFDIYSIKHSCGPHPQVCLSFDFRKIAGEYTEYSLKAVAIDHGNVKQKAELLLEQYGRTGSLLPHNVVLIPLGDDFRYDHDIEWDQQYRNYKMIFDYINNHKEYNAHLKFGTPSEYFKEVRARMKDFKTLKGDFFVYSDIFTEGRPAYWSGYFTTRPYWKILDRELEAQLRSGEILYTLALQRLRRLGFNSTLRILERDFEKLTLAREALGLFQHHDAITGTSKSAVMHDYALKLFEGLQFSLVVQGFSLQTLLSPSHMFEFLPLSFRFIVPDTERETYEILPRKIPLQVSKDRPKRIIVFNSLAHHRQELIRVHVKTPNIRVVDSDFKEVTSQVNPIWNLTVFQMKSSYHEGATSMPPLAMMSNNYEVVFIAELPPLSITTYQLEIGEGSRAVAYCKDCVRNEHFTVRKLQHRDIQIENEMIKLLIDGRTGLLKSIMDKKTGISTNCELQFASYPSAQFHSGAYLFMPDPNTPETEKDFSDELLNIRLAILNGPISSSLTVLHGETLSHTIEIIHSRGELGLGVQISNEIYFGVPPKNHETELFMRFKSDVSNGEPPEFYSDQNGFGTQKRVKIDRIGIEGNYYPITTFAFIQDTEKRLTLLTNHACGSASWQPGWLEVMLDRRTLYDDSRGMGEGIIDNKRTLFKFRLLVESLHQASSAQESTYVSPSLLANRLSLGLMYPANIFVLDSAVDEVTSVTVEQSLYRRVNLLTRDLPCDVHLMNLRTLQDPKLDHFPSKSALLVLEKFAISCDISSTASKCFRSTSTDTAAFPGTTFAETHLKLTKTTLTGLRSLGSICSLDELKLRPMSLAAVNVTFV